MRCSASRTPSGIRPGHHAMVGTRKASSSRKPLAGIAVKAEAIAVVRGEDDEGVVSVRRCAKGVHNAPDFGIDHFDHAVILINIILPIAARPLASTGAVRAERIRRRNCPEEAGDRPQFSMQKRICPGPPWDMAGKQQSCGLRNPTLKKEGFIRRAIFSDRRRLIGRHCRR